MWVQWSEQREYMDISWGCGWFIATMFVVINLIGQLGAVAMVLARYKVEIACGAPLFGGIIAFKSLEEALAGHEDPRYQAALATIVCAQGVWLLSVRKVQLAARGRAGRRRPDRLHRQNPAHSCLRLSIVCLRSLTVSSAVGTFDT